MKNFLRTSQIQQFKTEYKKKKTNLKSSLNHRRNPSAINTNRASLNHVISTPSFDSSVDSQKFEKK